MPVSEECHEADGEGMTVKQERQAYDASPGLCSGCGDLIRDRYYLLAVERQWHNRCLVCAECRQSLESQLTCFTRQGEIYCKKDYFRLFGIRKCARCDEGIAARELVMRARDLVYHVPCFICVECQRRFSPGDTCAVRDNLVYCQLHYENAQTVVDDHQSGEASKKPDELEKASPAFYNGAGAAQKGRPRKRKGNADMALACNAGRILTSMDGSDRLMSRSNLADGSQSLGGSPLDRWPGSSLRDAQSRSKRMRTSFKHHQLRAMKSYFALNQNPDAKDLKNLAQKTGLSKRVLQVWFQNARAKWRRSVLRQDNPNGVLVTDGLFEALSLEQELNFTFSAQAVAVNALHALDHGLADSGSMSPVTAGYSGSPDLSLGQVFAREPGDDQLPPEAMKPFASLYSD